MDNEDIMKDEDLKPKRRRGKGIIDPYDPPTPHERKPKSVEKYADPKKKIEARRQTYREYYERNKERLLERRRMDMDELARTDPEKYRAILDRAKNRYYKIKKKETEKDKQLYESLLASQQRHQKKRQKAEADGVELQVHKYTKRTPYKSEEEKKQTHERYLKKLRDNYQKWKDDHPDEYKEEQKKRHNYYEAHKTHIKEANLNRYYERYSPAAKKAKEEAKAAQAAQANESNTDNSNI